MTRFKNHSEFGSDWRVKYSGDGAKGVIQRKHSTWFDLYQLRGTLDEVVSFLTTNVNESELEDVQFRDEVEHGTYGDRDYDRLALTGWKDASPAEIAEKQAEVDETKAVARRYQERQIERLRAERPELF